MGDTRSIAVVTLALAFMEAAFAGDACLDHCALSRGDDGQLRPLCACSEKSFPAPFLQLREKFPRKFAAELRARMNGASPDDIATLHSGACARKPRQARKANDLRVVAALATRPLCECVNARIHFPLRLTCRASPAGQTVCDPSPDLSPSDRIGPIREASLYDYQSCIADRVNYRRPDTCEDVTCKETTPVCAAGEEAENVADPESCCPVFVCRAKEMP